MVRHCKVEFANVWSDIVCWQVSRIVGPEAYYMGIVDFQQLYNISKKVSPSS